MANRLKLFMGLLVVISILELIEMVSTNRFRREDSSHVDPALKTAEETLKKLIDAFSDIGEAIGVQLDRFKEKHEREV